MGYQADVVGMVRIRQIYSRKGRNYVAITIPTGIMDLWGWEPGDRLWYYPTKNKGLMMVKVQHSMELMPQFDESAMPDAKPVRGPRPGSLEARALEIEQEVDAMASSLAQRMKTRGGPTHPYLLDKLRKQREIQKKQLKRRRR